MTQPINSTAALNELINTEPTDVRGLTSGFETVVEAVAVCIQAQQACLLEGDPGVAKTSIVNALMNSLVDRHHVSIVALHEPYEYGGVVVPDVTAPRKFAALLPMDWMVKLSEPGVNRVGLVLDELSNGPPATRAAAMRGVHEGVWGDTVIRNLSTVAAMNPPEIAESGYELSAALSNRFCQIRWDMPTWYWVSQMLSDFPPPSVRRLPEGWRERWLPTARGLVAGFAKAKPTSIHLLPSDASARSKPWPSFRAWTMAMELIAAALSLGEVLKPNHISPLISILLSGCVGAEATREFFTYSTDLDLPDPEEVLRDPKSLVLPERGDKVYAILIGVVAAVLAKNTPERWTAGFHVLARAHELGKGDIAATAARLLAKDTNRPDRPPREAADAISLFVPMLREAALMR